MKIETGVMVMKNGKAWGITYEDGNLTSYGWVTPEEAIIYDPEHCKQPEDVVYRGGLDAAKLRTGKLVHIERRTEVLLMDQEIDSTGALPSFVSEAKEPTKPRPELLALAEKCGARLTGKPDGSESVTVVFTVDAWRAFDAVLGPIVKTQTNTEPGMPVEA